MGAIEVGYTPPGLLGEDELMFTKKVALIPHAATYRLSASIMKIFYPPTVGSYEFGASVFLPKLVRWFVGWIEVHGYLLSWLCGRVPGHPRVVCPLKSLGMLILTIVRLYTSFVILFSAIPMAEIYSFGGHATYEEHLTSDMIGHMMKVQRIAFLVSFSLTLFSAARIHSRMFNKFDCLKFHPKSLISYPTGFVVFMFLPLPIWWCYLKHGVLNKPVVHTAQTDHLSTLPQCPLPPSKPDCEDGAANHDLV